MGHLVHAASRPGGHGSGQDRWTATATGVIVLDGASAFDSAAPPADAYVDALLAALTVRLDTDTDLRTVLHDAIADTAQRLHLTPGGPSSTVMLLREAGETVELAVLGDSTAVAIITPLAAACMNGLFGPSGFLPPMTPYCLPSGRFRSSSNCRLIPPAV